MLDPEGRVTTWNDGAQRVTGYSAEEILGQSIARFYTEADRTAGVPLQALATARTTGRCAIEGWYVRKDGTRFWGTVTINSLRDTIGALIGFAKITHDVTERRQAEEALEATLAALAQAQKLDAIGQLTGGVAHDFNNLLTAILGGVELLEHRPHAIEPESANLLSMIRRASERGATLTQRLLAFSRKQTLTPQLTDLIGWSPGCRTCCVARWASISRSKRCWPAGYG
ncbi:MAG TPA: PAS domain S-box protein [Acetobacteraceae bacterium]|jgi:PAS domain S-box-containing protein|nr:PAS domain S-box protein [Acetobacteraceae bacterium]